MNKQKKIQRKKQLPHLLKIQTEKLNELELSLKIEKEKSKEKKLGSGYENVSSSVSKRLFENLVCKIGLFKTLPDCGVPSEDVVAESDLTLGEGTFGIVKVDYTLKH